MAGPDKDGSNDRAENARPDNDGPIIGSIRSPYFESHPWLPWWRRGQSELRMTSRALKSRSWAMYMILYTFTHYRATLQSRWWSLRSLGTDFIAFLLSLWLAWVFSMCMTFMIIFIDLLIFFINYYIYTSTHICTHGIKCMWQLNKITEILLQKSQQLYRCRTST